jgi:hypothetical protein
MPPYNLDFPDDLARSDHVFQFKLIEVDGTLLSIVLVCGKINVLFKLKFTVCVNTGDK